MLATDFAGIRYFTKDEAWGDIALLDLGLVRTLDAFRSLLARPIVVTCGTQGQHEPNSQHYIGHAVDVVFPDPVYPRELFDICTQAMRFPGFTGVGIYPHWKYKDQVIGGLHLDNRTTLIRHQWVGYLIGTKQVYGAFSHEMLSKVGLI